MQNTKFRINMSKISCFKRHLREIDKFDIDIVNLNDESESVFIM